MLYDKRKKEVKNTDSQLIIFMRQYLGVKHAAVCTYFEIHLKK